VDGHDANRVHALVDHGSGRLAVAHALLEREVLEEAADPGAARALVLAGEAGELEHVRVGAAPVGPPREQEQVVVEMLARAVDDLRGRGAALRWAGRFDRRLHRADGLAVSGRKVGLVRRGPQRLAARLHPQLEQAVVRQRAHPGGEHMRYRLVVQWVRHGTEERTHGLDLGPPEERASRHDHVVEVVARERGRVLVRMRHGAQEHHDVALVHSWVHERAQAAGQCVGLAVAGLRGGAVAAVDSEQLDSRSARRQETRRGGLVSSVPQPQ
jgi:hypothetical protein